MKNKYFLIAITIIFVLALSYTFGLHSKLYRAIYSPVKMELPAPNVPIKEYVLGAKVDAVNGKNISVTVSRIMVGENGNFVDVQKKTATISDTTIIFLTKLENKKFTKTPGTLADIKVGSNVSFYSSENIAVKNTFTPTRVDVSQN